MKPLYKITCILFLLPTLIFGAHLKNKHERSKTIKKEFNVNANATLSITNKYGNVDVTTWDENRIVIEIKITVKGNDLDDVQDKLNRIDVKFDASKSLVEARTIIGSKKSRWSWWGKNKNTNYQINYFVKMPINNSADLTNQYGGISLSELKGPSSIYCDYGKISIDKLHNKTNTIDLDYCPLSTINYIKSGNISADYSKLTIEESDKLTANTDYTNLTVGNVREIDFNSDYGNVTINDAFTINGNSDYTSIRIGTLKKRANIHTDYGGLRIKNLAKGFENITIDGSYAGIKIETSSHNNFDFVVDLGYAGFNYTKENVVIFKSIEKTSNKHYEGTWGQGKTGSKIFIKSGYGSVSIKQND